jgi:hypothetical protein
VADESAFRVPIGKWRGTPGIEAGVKVEVPLGPGQLEAERCTRAQSEQVHRRFPSCPGVNAQLRGVVKTIRGERTGLHPQSRRGNLKEAGFRQRAGRSRKAVRPVRARGRGGGPWRRRGAPPGIRRRAKRSAIMWWFVRVFLLRGKGATTATWWGCCAAHGRGRRCAVPMVIMRRWFRRFRVFLLIIIKAVEKQTNISAESRLKRWEHHAVSSRAGQSRSQARRNAPRA